METNGDNGDGIKGNTRSLIPRQNQGKKWIFTYNNYPEDAVETMENRFKELNILYIIGKEIAPTTGTPHLQGYFESEKRIRPTEALKLDKKIHYETAKGTREENLRYCSKDKKYITNFNLELELENTELEILKDEQLYDWQKEIIEIIKTKPDKRTINWYWEPDGCCGKTEFGKYLAYKYNAIPLEGKKNDILYCAAEFQSRLYIWDLERDMEEYISYSALEKIKNGFFMCAKYESKPIIRNNPHIIVFANFRPDTKRLSKDRWNIKRIIKEEGIAVKEELEEEECAFSSCGN